LPDITQHQIAFNRGNLAATGLNAFVEGIDFVQNNAGLLKIHDDNQITQVMKENK
jgi:hypothetical protein